jgi:hypothetical protein
MGQSSDQEVFDEQTVATLGAGRILSALVAVVATVLLAPAGGAQQRTRLRR